MDKWQIIASLYRKRDAYKRLFLDSDGKLRKDAEIVIRDLRRYCRRGGIIGYRDSLGRVDPLSMANANGRREVYDRIARYLYLDDRAEVRLEAGENEDD
jgi:hypothetical protein